MARQRRPQRHEVVADMLAAAARVVADRGLGAASVEAICEEAGYTTGALYSNFDGKEDLFLRLYEDRIERRARALRAALADSGGGRSGLVAAATEWARAVLEDREWFILYFEFALRAARDPRFAERFQRLRTEGLDELAAGIEKALLDAGVSSSLERRDLAQAIRAVNYGFALDRLIDETSVAPALPADVLRMLVRGASSS